MFQIRRLGGVGVEREAGGDGPAGAVLEGQVAAGRGEAGAHAGDAVAGGFRGGLAVASKAAIVGDLEDSVLAIAVDAQGNLARAAMADGVAEAFLSDAEQDFAGRAGDGGAGGIERKLDGDAGLNAAPEGGEVVQQIGKAGAVGCHVMQPAQIVPDFDWIAWVAS